MSSSPCEECEGTGELVSSYDPSPSGVSLSSGVLYDGEPCPACIARDPPLIVIVVGVILVGAIAAVAAKVH